MSSNISTMSHEDKVYGLTFKDLNDDSVANVSRTRFYCSFIQYVRNETAYRLQSDEELDKISSLCQNASSLAWAALWLCLSLGIPGNTAAIVIIASMPKSTGTFLILVLAVSDFSALIIKALDYLLGHYQAMYSSFLCQSFYALSNYSGIFANWILVFIAMERFVTAQFPLQKKYFITMKRARLSVLGLSLFLVPIGIIDFLGIEWRNRKCTYSPQLTDFYPQVWLHVLNALFSFIPAGLILVFVLLVTVALRKQQRTRNFIMSDMTIQRENHVENDTLRRQRLDAQKLETAITIMMSVTLVVFLIITIPVCVVIIIHLSIDEKAKSPTLYAQLRLAMRVTLALTLSSHCINPYIYFLSTRRYRNYAYAVIKKCFCCSKEA